MKYFAYASNVSPARMRFKGVMWTARESARAYGWQLAFNAEGEREGQGYGNLMAAPPDQAAEGVLYDIHPGDLFRLDSWEKCPEAYERRTVKVVTQKGIIIEAEAYIARSEITKEGLKPTREYLNWILEGKPDFSGAYYEKLEATETLD